MRATSSCFYTRDQIMDLMGARTPTCPANPRSKDTPCPPAEAFGRINWNRRGMWQAFVSETFDIVGCASSEKLVRTPKVKRPLAAYRVVMTLADQSPETAASLTRKLTTLAAQPVR